MRRIAYVINFIVKGGPSAVVLNMIHNLDRTRFEPVLITLFEGNSPEIVARKKEAGLKIVECGHKSRFQFLLHGISEYRRIICGDDKTGCKVLLNSSSNDPYSAS